ncbi:MAG: hypothetical protein FJ137_23025 [Deltaproteobacteria bacterium]|nr:hypothetical protein [Deltaproteobacteria bacterium]
MVELAQLRLRRGKSAEAIAAAEAAFAVEPDALPVLEVLAETREVAGHRAAAAEAWRRVAALKSGGERRKALERGARGFVDAGRHEDAARTWFELFQESNDPRHRSEGEACAARGSSAAAAPPLTSEATVADDEPAERT